MKKSEALKRNKIIIEEYNKGEKSLKEIGEMFNTTKQNISRILQKNGIYPRELIKCAAMKNLKLATDAKIDLKIKKYKARIDELMLEKLNLENTLKMREKKISQLEKLLREKQ